MHSYDNFHFWSGIKRTLKKTWFQCIFFFHTAVFMFCQVYEKHSWSVRAGCWARAHYRVTPDMNHQSMAAQFVKSPLCQKERGSSRKSSRNWTASEQTWNTRLLACYHQDLLKKTLKALLRCSGGHSDIDLSNLWRDVFLVGCFLFCFQNKVFLEYF